MALQCMKFFEKVLSHSSYQRCRATPRISVPFFGTSHVRSIRTNSPRQLTMPELALDQEGPTKNRSGDSKTQNEVITRVNQQIEKSSHGRLFAVIHLCGKQFKVTNEDLIVLEAYWDPQVGDKIKMEKVLLIGGSDFTVVGRPIVSTDLVHVEGTVIEKSLSHIKTHFRKRPRKQYQRINFYRCPLTFVRINAVEFRGPVNEHRDVVGIEGRIF